MQMTDRVYCIALAALLHDIGKPLQRACGSDKGKLGTDAKSMDRADLVGYAHSLWTADFIFRNRAVFEKLDAVRTYGFENFQKLASKHHKPDGDRVDEQIICDADRASAGGDREGKESEENDRTTYITRPLDSLFTRVTLEDKKPGKRYYTLGNLHDADVFPKPDSKLSSEMYAHLMKQFESDFVTIATDNQELFLDAAVSLVVKYFWCVPSSTLEEYADIPLADHLLTTSAIASAMAIGCEETGCKPRQVSYKLVAGDFSGIQKYIFALTGESNRSVAQLLRGRSFLVNLYTVLSARMLSDSCGLPALNCITNAGGKFLLIIPDTPHCSNSLAETKTAIEKWTFDKFFGELKILIDDGVRFEYNEFSIKSFQKVMAKSSESLNRQKLRPFSPVLDNENLWVDNKRYGDFQKSGSCKLCGHEPGLKEKNGTMLGSHCLNAIETGQKVTKSNFVVLYSDSTGIFGHYRVEYSDKLSANADDMLMCYRINLHCATNNCWPELHYANYVPLHEMCENYDCDEGDNLQCKTFEDIAQDGDGLDALAVLKADVDNMGQLFAFGFKKKDGTASLSISRMVAMSRMINWFFAGYMPQIIAKNKELYGNIYTLFAGGDDLCMIGRWDTMIAFSKEIQEKFNKYTGENEVITISAGLELFKPGFPVVRAIDNAELLLDRSKAEVGKNSISVFNCTLNWGKEYSCQLEFPKHWTEYIKNVGTENRSAMLYRFLNYYKNYKNNTDSINSLKHRFQLIYDISRNVNEKWINKPPFVNLIATKVEKTDLFKNFEVGISIALYSNRSKEI